MRQTDIVITGAGLAGSTAAAMLARRGFDVTLIDPHSAYPVDLRCEKLIGRQVKILRRTGLADVVLPAATLDGECWISQFGRVVDKRPADQYGILYHTLVNTMRGAIPAETPFIQGKVTQIVNSPHLQTVAVSTGEEISARLVIVANGLNSGLRTSLGMIREDVSKCHCITVAFDLKPVGRSRFDFRAMTCFPERADQRVAYLSLFPIGDMMHANMMIYRDLEDPWLQMVKQQPEVALLTLMPRLERLIGSFEVVGPVKFRPADLYATRSHLKAGVVLVGDAFSTSCPAAGTGTDKVFTDVERLCNVHVPQWMASRGMGVEKIAAFYSDPVKLACDRYSLEKAFKGRSASINEGLSWRTRRWARFCGRLAIGTARATLLRFAASKPAP